MTSIAELDKRILAARTVQWNASQMHRASGVFAAERILDKLYRERDAERQRLIDTAPESRPSVSTCWQRSDCT